MKKMRAFFSWEPRPPQAGEGIFSCKILDWAHAKRDKHWVCEWPPSGINAGFVSSRQAGSAGFALLQRLYEVLLQGGDGGGVGQRAVFAVGEVEGVFDFFAVGADFGVADVDVVREQDAADV